MLMPTKCIYLYYVGNFLYFFSPICLSAAFFVVTLHPNLIQSK